MDVKKRIRYFIIGGMLLGAAYGLFSAWNKSLERIDNLKRQYPAFAVVYDSVGQIIQHMDDARYYAKEGTYENALIELDKADLILDKKKVNYKILKDLVNKGIITKKDKEEVELLQAQIIGLRKEFMTGYALQKKGKIM